MKTRLTIALAALLVIALIGCGAFTPSPSITSFTATEESVAVGDTVTLTIQGTTVNDMGMSSTTDYAGTVRLTCSSLSYDESATFDSDADESFSVTMDTAGTYTFTATLEASDGSSDSWTIEIDVAGDPNPWDGTATAYSQDDDKGDWITGYSISPAGDVDWFSFLTDGSDSRYVVHWQDSYDYVTNSSYYGDVKVTVYDETGNIIGGPQDSGCWDDGESAGTVGPYDGIEIDVGTDITMGDTVYVKVEGYSSSSTGDYELYFW